MEPSPFLRTIRWCSKQVVMRRITIHLRFEMNLWNDATGPPLRVTFEHLTPFSLSPLPVDNLYFVVTRVLRVCSPFPTFPRWSAFWIPSLRGPVAFQVLKLYTAFHKPPWTAVRPAPSIKYIVGSLFRGMKPSTSTFSRSVVK